MRLSIVGCGGISRAHMEAVSRIPDARLISVADIIPERAEDIAEVTDAVPYTSLTAMLDAEKPDVLHICTPHYLHVTQALEAMNRGIHVLIEKPCAVTLEELDTLRRAQTRTGLKVGTCFQNRYNHAAIQAKALLEEERYGPLRGVRGFVTWKRGASYYADDWHGTLDKECGGVLINQAIHTLDMMQYLAGEYTALTGHIANDHLKGVVEVETTASALLEFKNGLTGVFYATLANACDSPVFIEFLCEQANLRMEGDNLYIVHPDGRVEAARAFEQKDYPGKACWGTGHYALICDFYNSIIEDRPFDIDAYAGGKALEAVLAIYRSARTDSRETVGQ